MKQHQEIEHNVEQLHLSATVLVMKMAFLLFILDSAFLLLLLGFFVLGNYPDAHHHYTIFLVVAQTIKYILLTAVAIQLVTRWSSRNIYISGHHLIISSGVTRRTQKVYELEQLRLVEVRQDWLGQQLKFGNILLTFAASGFKQDVVLSEMAHPRACAKVIEKYMGEGQS